MLGQGIHGFIVCHHGDGDMHHLADDGAPGGEVGRGAAQGVDQIEDIGLKADSYGFKAGHVLIRGLERIGVFPTKGLRERPVQIIANGVNLNRTGAL